MKSSEVDSFLQLKSWCEGNDFKGWDPYDGLNSKVFQATPLRHWSISRLLWIQFFKRNPVNLRRFFLVPKGYNPKALGLFLSGYCNLYRIAEKGDETFGTKEELRETIQYLAKKLLELQSEGYSGACWGYNFDWQARGGLFFPAYTPTVVATTFAANGLLDASQVLNDKEIEKTAISSAEFVVNDLPRTQKEEGFLFSYAPKFGNNTVYNASLLGSRLLARIYSFTSTDEYAQAAHSSVLACCNAQNTDGSWYYGELEIQRWIDSFHTGFNLEAIYDYQKFTGDTSFQKCFEEGFEYYIENFFLQDGTPKYYHDKIYPVDIHSPAQFIVTLYKTGRFPHYSKKVTNVLEWTLENMQDSKGYFYYQINKAYIKKISYMRWSQAWMFYALTFYIKSQCSIE